MNFFSSSVKDYPKKIKLMYSYVYTLNKSPLVDRTKVHLCYP